MDMYLRYQRLGYTAPIGPQSHPITIHRIVVYGLARVSPRRAHICVLSSQLHNELATCFTHLLRHRKGV